MAMRGIDLISATTLLAEIGDLSRFRTPRELMAYLGLVPSETSTGDTVRRGPITKAGNHRARRTLVECSWSYQHPPRVGKEKQEKVAAAPRAVREIAWKAQCRLTARYRALIRKGKLKNRRRDRGRTRARGLHLGHQSRGQQGPRGGQIRRVFRGKGKATRSTPFQGAMPGQRSGEDNLVQRRGRSHGRGTPDGALRPIARSTPVRRQGKPQTKIRICVEPADQRMITDVPRLRPYRCTIIASITFHGVRGEAGLLRRRA